MSVEPLVEDPAAVLPAQREPDEGADQLSSPVGRVTRPPNQYWDVAQAAWVVNQR